jgi:DNA-binding NtrC family response regulator
MKVLIVEDDLATRKGLEESIKDLGFEARSVGTSKEAAKVIDEYDPRILIVDIHLPDGDGIEVLRLAREKDPDREGVVITGQGSIDNAIEALRVGAFDYLLKPLRPAQLEVVFNRLADRRRLETEVETLRAELQETGRLGDLVGRSRPMTEIFEIIRRVARSNAPVLVTGASGSGKEVAARTIHRLSRRAGKPFVAFNCGAISPTLIESELFGHERGSFTGADKRRVGYFEEAMGGTLFLDEITEMGPELQVKLLRVRLISATNRDPHEAMAEKKLREDLYYRLNVFPIALPLLTERRDDIPLLAEHFRKLIEEQEKAGVTGWDPGALQVLNSYDWPGNVRELRNIVHRAYVMTEGKIIRADVVQALVPVAGSGRARRKDEKPPRGKSDKAPRGKAAPSNASAARRR